ncbi:MAG: hypothetical protein QOC93_3 [Actinomycetota bacterium]|jgi:hypothetical protein|nr:hypothetical protein [Cryptosporangiaceae bacterium]MDQ1674859.1 hypothetical protein [Actinomycetota bacterium]
MAGRVLFVLYLSGPGVALVYFAVLGLAHR